MKNPKSIKISSTHKGEHHWEKHLMLNQKKRVYNFLMQLELGPWDKREINRLFDSRVNFDNIIKIHSHPVRIFIMHLLHDQLEELDNYSSIETITN